MTENSPPSFHNSCWIRPIIDHHPCGRQQNSHYEGCAKLLANNSPLAPQASLIVLRRKLLFFHEKDKTNRSEHADPHHHQLRRLFSKNRSHLMISTDKFERQAT